MIEINNIHKVFHGKKVLKSVDLTVQTGETMVVIGCSGCGKSVLLKHIIGLLKPDSGRISIDKEDITKMDEKQLRHLRMRFGMLFQSSALFDSLNVAENVAFSLMEHTDLDRKVIMHKVRSCLSLVGLSGIEHSMPSELSGGMKKRVGLARAICVDPQIVLYDEPTTGIDPIMADAINDLIRDLQDKLKITSIVVTHDMISAYKVADRIAMLYEGRIIEVGTPNQIKNTSNPVVKQFITGAAEGPITHREAALEEN
ncbi:MAG: ABC transporter ATP-binding protein [Candidatus Omnitrophica bacterium CG12_big_fil_rev_8_21_14_0_65_43_15]|uniref:ABC transporter ATP-binding protein n=1 Tax=Candidatus Taenaricola geysiri TaxID=1974752 RepID=A0A2J0LK09_9BACT|nr:MAG: ABC transporter ATP-binding protein [Candidatus Omnitrophica bacterium CG03_land_8_20_14_0_80_43_22]PIW65933.1 MAG: ABC transporter ATP-binding protein [Candidatus Omnitrophica bacterium CG12_big_fil_rev_8_21_14_0_65_43_15]PIW79922.1 MAG: ABC transporter ATP-binding protein [Candidatus Omnitrophica bacterium CG_4_8_14_3_um_filter_43_15]